MPNLFRNLPSVSQLLENPQLKKMIDTANRNVVVDGVRTFLDDFRDQISSTAEEVKVPSANELAERIAKWLKTQESPSLRPVVNATGILLHTGLGRAPLAAAAREAVNDISQCYASVEVDLKSGQRGNRNQAVGRLLCQLTGAEAAIVVNNNAAATLLTLSALATDREVIVSRGQLVEIGGSYRLPEVMESSGARLREVGTTNKTRVQDYESAIGENTGAILKVHPSNFEVVGFIESVTTGELVSLARQHDLPVIDDIGSGAMIDFSKYGLKNEPLAADSIHAGADVVLFSGDKLLGGPQCGIIIGKQKYIDLIFQHPLTRAMRVGKMTLAALAATLALYRHPEVAELEIPLLRMLSMPIANLKLRAEKISQQIEVLEKIESCEVIEQTSMIGGGSLPSQQIATWCVAISPAGETVDGLARRLRMAPFPVIGRISDDRLLLDLRTIDPSQDIALVITFENL